MRSRNHLDKNTESFDEATSSKWELTTTKLSKGSEQDY